MTDTQLALCEVRGPLNTLNDYLDSADGRVWLTALKKFLRKENPWEKEQPPFPRLPHVRGSEKVLLKPTITELPGVILAGSEVSLEDQIAKAGYCGQASSDINAARFDLTLPAGPQDLALIHFDVIVTSEEVKAWAAANGYELALIDDLLAVGSHSEYKELQRQFPVIALGSSAFIDDDWCVPCLDMNDSGRQLCPEYWGGDWGEDCRFLLRKVTPVR